MLLLAYLLTRNAEWRGAEIKILSVASNEFARHTTEQYLTRLLPELRIDAVFDVIVKPAGSSVRDVIRRQSGDADVVFLGLAIPEHGREVEYATRMEDMAGGLPVVFFVKNASLFVGRLVQSEDVEGTGEDSAPDAGSSEG